MKKKTKKNLHSKRFSELKEKINKEQTYPIEEAVKLVKETATTKFDSTLEVAIKTGIDPKKSEQQIRSTVSLPHGTGKKIKIAVIAPEKDQKEAKAAGASIVGGEELIEKIAKTQKVDFDILITIPEMMKDLAKIAKILGPKGMMPNPKTDTVTPNVKKAVEELTKGRVSYKNDDTGNIHLALGKASFDDQKIIDNYQAFIDALNKIKPSSIKGTYLKNITLSSSMGPGVKVQIN